MVGFLRDFEISNNFVSVYVGKVYFIMRIARLAVGLGDVWVTLAKTSDVEYIKVSDTPYPLRKSSLDQVCTRLPYCLVVSNTLK
jgi:hypothetical protein